MLKILLSGSNGRLGGAIACEAAKYAGLRVVAGVNLDAEKTGSFPAYADPFEFTGECDVVVDCSHPAALSGLLRYCELKGTPLVLCTTGYSDSDLAAIERAAQKIAVFRSSNMSLGVALLCDLAKKAAALLGDSFDVEIIERHHRGKLDAPSGTAYMLFDAVREALPYSPTPVYDRQARRDQRGKAEIGLHAIRGGTITGDHTVLFAGTDETVEIKHSASSRAVFATGAVKAARFMCGKQSGLYGMSDLVASV